MPITGKPRTRPAKAKPRKGTRAAFVAAQGRRKANFELSMKAYNLLRETSLERNIAQVTLIELMIRRYLDKEVPTYDEKLY